MNLKLLWILSLSIIVGIGFGLLSFSIDWLDMEKSIIPVLIYLGMSTILFLVDRTSVLKNKLLNSLVFILVSVISHWLPSLTILALYILKV